MGSVRRHSPLVAVAVALSALFLAPRMSLAGDEIIERPTSAVEDRFSRSEFRNCLKARGLTDLLELYLRDYPPAGQVDALLMQRDIKLSEFSDPSRSVEERRTAIAEANQILGQLIADHGYDLRHFQWRYVLAHSLIYDEAERFITNILYRGGTVADRNSLSVRAGRAVELLDSLKRVLKLEYTRLDGLPILEFERLDRRGFVSDIDAMAPKVDYLMLWAWFYEALARDTSDRNRIRELHAIRDKLASQPAILRTPHSASRVQIPAVLLAGMVERRLNNLDRARSYFGAVFALVRRVKDSAERERLEWAVTLAHIERVHNERDRGKYGRAIEAVEGFREFVSGQASSGFGLQMVAALLERSIHRAQAAEASRAGRRAEAARFNRAAWQSMAGLASRMPERRDEIYATLFDFVGLDTPPDRLDPFEQCAVVAGLLFDASGDEGTRGARLDRAVLVGEWFLAHVGDGADSLLPEVLFKHPTFSIAAVFRARQAVSFSSI